MKRYQIFAGSSLLQICWFLCNTDSKVFLLASVLLVEQNKQFKDVTLGSGKYVSVFNSLNDKLMDKIICRLPINEKNFMSSTKLQKLKI